MPIYFIDTAGPDGTFRDDEGVECADRDAVEYLTRKALSEIAADKGASEEGYVYTAKVRDAAGSPIYKATITLTAARL